MGVFKQMKELKRLGDEAPDAVLPTEAGANAEALAAAYQARAAAQAAAVPPPPAGAAEGPDFEPIANVSLELYARISRRLAAAGYDRARAADVAASQGVTGPDWDAAVSGWNARMRVNPAVGKRFHTLYTAAS